MFGGYYLGQLYLGISGLPSSGSLSVQQPSHQLSSDNVTLVQKHTIVVDSTTHSINSDNLYLVEHKTLIIANASHGHTAQGVTLAVRSYLDVANALHSHIAQNVALTQKHVIVVNNTTHSLLTDALGGLINIQPYGFGGGYGAIEAWGVKHFGEINIELPLNYLIIADNAVHNLWFDDFDTFVQIFNMIRTGIYIKDFEKDGEVGEQYTPGSGTMPTNNGYFGQITPVPESNHGFFVVDMGTSGSYIQNNVNDGILTSGNSSSGTYSTDEQDTGNYIKIK